MSDLEFLRKYEMAEGELRDYIARFFEVADERETPTPVFPPSPEEVAEMARLRQVADAAWMEWMASSTPKADPATP